MVNTVPPAPARPRRRACAALLAGLSCACAAPARALMAGLAPDSAQRRLDDNAAQSPWSGVGSFGVHGGVYTGVLLAGRYALTASHVIPAEPSDAVFNLNLGGDLTHALRVRRAIRHPAPRALAEGMHSGDLALVELAEPAPPEARRYSIARAPAPQGTPITVVGYGDSGNADRGPTVPANAALRRVGENLIEGVVADPATHAPLLYLFRFDAPPAGAKLRTPSLGNLRETGLARGDSGSPAFVRTPGGWALLGINSFVVQPAGPAHVPFGFGSWGGGQFLAPHLDWIESVIGAG